MKGKSFKAGTILREIRRVIRVEARALDRVGRAVDSSFAKAVQWMAACRGKVITMGVGKSGSVAEKIAATLSSTGTPALFLDATEALHGSLGLIQRQDLLLAFGKSGESDELKQLIPSIRRTGAKFIMVTGDPSSTLARKADLMLWTPIADEACPLNLAPTSSTTAALAVGDALALALMMVKNFKKEQFAQNHPGGRLGKRLNLTAGDVMRSGEDNPVVHVDDTARSMLVELTRKHAGAVSVVDKRGRLVGLVADYDVRMALNKGGNLFAMTIRDIMNARPTSVGAHESAAKAADLMKKRKNPFSVLSVVDRKGRAVGMIQVHDLRALGL